MTDSRAPATGFYDYLPQERVVFGAPAAEAVTAEADRLAARRIFVVASRSLHRRTPVVKAVIGALGDRHVGTFDGCVAHAPRATVIAAAEAVRAADPDLIVTLGGGTVVDTVKILQVCLAEDIRTPDAMDAYHMRVDAAGRTVAPAVRPSPVRQIIVPTTLSGAEYSNLGASTDIATGRKHTYTGPDICGRVVILDPAATVHTPDWLWLSSGIRAVDHAVEAICAPDANPYCDGLALHALRLFAEALPRTMDEPADLVARLACQQAVWMASASILRVSYGASHGIGHALGAIVGVPHGQTSCVMLAHVLRYNEAVTATRQALIAEALGRPGGSAGDAVAALVARLGQPATLRAVGATRDQLPRIADAALENIWLRTNPRPITTADEVMKILDAAW